MPVRCRPAELPQPTTDLNRKMGRTAKAAMQTEGGNMNVDILQGKWQEIKGEVKTKWGKLTDNDLTEIEGIEEKLLGLLQKRYGYAREEAEQEFKEFMERYNSMLQPKA